MYARGTSVSVEKSRAEIETVLRRYGASHFAYMAAPDKATVAFQARDRRIRFDLPLPDINAKQFQRDGRGTPLSPVKRHERWEQACREKWRALALCIKAKLEAVESHIESFEDAFLAHIILDDGRTVGEVTIPRLAQIYAGENVPLLPPPG
jgi:hypothetical protein